MDVLLNFIFSLVGADSFVLPEEKRKKFRFSPKGALAKEASEDYCEAIITELRTEKGTL